MNVANIGRGKLFGFALATCLVYIGLLGTGHAHAGTNQLPNTGDDTTGSTLNVVVSSRDPNRNNRLDATNSTIKLFVPNTAASVDVHIVKGGFCGYGPPDSGDTYYGPDFFGAGTFFQMVGTDANEGDTGVVRVQKTNYDAGCGDYTINLNKSDFATSSIPGHTGYWVVIVKALIAAGPGSLNGFKYYTNTTGAAFSYYAGSGNHFAVIERDGVKSNDRSSISFKFAPNCNETGNIGMRLNWFDDDWGTSYQVSDGFYVTVLNEYDTNGNFVREVDRFQPNFGEDVNGYRDVTLRAGFKYDWVWHGVEESNGVQFQLPRDGFNFIQSCAPIAKCNYIDAPDSVESGQKFYAGFNVSNNTGESWTRGGPWKLGATGLDAAGNYDSSKRDATTWGGGRIEVRHGVTIDSGKDGVFDDNYPSPPAATAYFSLTAPVTATTQTYNFTWEVLKEGVAWVDKSGCSKTITVTPPVVRNPSCGGVNTSLNTKSPEQSVPFSFRVSVNYDSGVPDNRYTMTVNAPGLGYNNANAAFSYDTTARTISFSTAPTTFTPASGTYQVTWTFVGDGGVNISCSDPLNVVTRPYMRVYGGDVTAGVLPACSKWQPNSNSTGSIFAFNSGSGAGAGTELMTQALRQIEQFTSAQNRTAAPTVDTGLTMANTSGSYGGNFDNGVCPNLFELNSATYTETHSGDFTETGRSSMSGVNTVFVDGDVYISGEITYQNSGGGWAQISDIPAYVLIAKGNIYIGSGVHNLNGIFVAEPKTNGSGGTIYTCANGLRNLPSQGDLAAAAGVCNSGLTVNGALVARTVKFLRSRGTSAKGQMYRTVELRYGPIIAAPAGFNCVSINEPGSTENGLWLLTKMCAKSSTGATGIAYSSGGQLGGKSCDTLLNEAAEPDPPATSYINNAWTDNYLCFNPEYDNHEFSFVSSETGQGSNSRDTQEASGKTCLNMAYPENAIGDPHTWKDNYVCYLPVVKVSPNSPYTEASSSTNIAETIIYSPEVWLRAGSLLRVPGSDPNKLDSITSLPPIL